jgi:hypothetical protein
LIAAKTEADFGTDPAPGTKPETPPDETPPVELPAAMLPGGTDGSPAVLLETWMTRTQSDGVAAFFERFGGLPGMRPATRAGAALEIGRGRIRYFELQPAGDRLVAMRFESVMIQRVEGDLATRERSIVAGLAKLHQRLEGRIAPCAVLLQGTKTTARVVALQQATRHIARLSSSQILGATEASMAEQVTDHRTIAKVRAGSSILKTVLVTSAERAEVESVTRILASAHIPVARMSTGEISFLQTIVPAAARTDQDFAEAFVSVDSSGVTVCFAARGVAILSQTFPLPEEYSADSLELTREVAAAVNKAAKEFEFTCRGGEIRLFHYLCSLPGDEDPTLASKRLSSRLGRPVELVQPDLLLKIDPDSTATLGVPVDALAMLAAPAVEAATVLEGVDLVGGARLRNARTAVAAGNAAAALLVAAVLSGWGSRPGPGAQAAIERLRTAHAKLETRASIADERAELLLRRDAQAALERDRAIAARFAEAPAPELEATLALLARVKPDDLYVQSVRLARDDASKGWALELEAVAGPGKGDAAAAVAAFTRELRGSAGLGDVTAETKPGSQPGVVVLRARAKVRP